MSRQNLGFDKHHKLDDLPYVVAVANLTATPVLVSSKAYSLAAGIDAVVDVSGTVLSGAGSVSGTNVTTPIIVGSAMTVGVKYRIVLEVGDGGSQRFALFFDLDCIGETVAA